MQYPVRVNDSIALLSGWLKSIVTHNSCKTFSLWWFLCVMFRWWVSPSHEFWLILDTFHCPLSTKHKGRNLTHYFSYSFVCVRWGRQRADRQSERLHSVLWESESETSAALGIKHVKPHRLCKSDSGEFCWRVLSFLPGRVSFKRFFSLYKSDNQKVHTSHKLQYRFYKTTRGVIQWHI